MSTRLLAILLIAATPAPLLAQTGTNAESTRQAGTTTLSAPANLTFGAIPGASADAASSAVQIILDASTKDKTGTAAFGWKTGQRLMQLSFSGPVGSSEETTPLSVAGLGGGAKAKFSLNRMFWRGPSPFEMAEMESMCQREGLMPEGTGPGGAFTDEDFRKYKESRDEPCSSDLFTNPRDRALYETLMHKTATPWLLGLDASIGHVTHRFVKPDSLESASEQEEEWTVAARVGYFEQGLGFLLASVSQAVSLKAAGPATEICRPMTEVTANNGAIRCDQVIVGGPTRIETTALTLELRRLVSSKFATSPSLTLDLHEGDDGKHVWGLEVPVYFLTTAGSSSPTGGVRFGWRSDQRELTAVLFIGGAFQMFK